MMAKNTQMTSVLLPPELKAAVQSEAKDMGVSMAAVIRWALTARYGEQLKAHAAAVIASERAGEEQEQ